MFSGEGDYCESIGCSLQKLKAYLCPYLKSRVHIGVGYPDVCVCWYPVCLEWDNARNNEKQTETSLLFYSCILAQQHDLNLGHVMCLEWLSVRDHEDTIPSKSFRAASCLDHRIRSPWTIQIFHHLPPPRRCGQHVAIDSGELSLSVRQPPKLMHAFSFLHGSPVTSPRSGGSSYWANICPPTANRGRSYDDLRRILDCTRSQCGCECGCWCWSMVAGCCSASTILLLLEPRTSYPVRSSLVLPRPILPPPLLDIGPNLRRMTCSSRMSKPRQVLNLISTIFSS